MRRWFTQFRRNLIRSRKEQRDWEAAHTEAQVSRGRMFDEIEARFWRDALARCLERQAP